MFPYAGSKKRELKKIFQHVPNDCALFVDVFGGGGSVSIESQKRGFPTILNDKSDLVFSLYKIVKRNDQPSIMKKFFDKYTDREKYKELKTDVSFTEAEKFIICSRICFKGNITPNLFKKKINMKPTFKKFPFDLITLKHRDAFELIEKYKDDEDVCIYCDPPYVFSFCKDYEQFSVYDHMKLLGYLSSCKCRIIINVPYSYYYHEKYGKYLKDVYQIFYMSKQDSSEQKKYFLKISGTYHCILSNY